MTDEPYGDWNAAAELAPNKNRPMAERAAALRLIDQLTGEIGGDYSPADVEQFTKERAEVLGLAEQADRIDDLQRGMNNAIGDLIDDDIRPSDRFYG